MNTEVVVSLVRAATEVDRGRRPLAGRAGRDIASLHRVRVGVGAVALAGVRPRAGRGKKKSTRSSHTRVVFAGNLQTSRNYALRRWAHLLTQAHTARVLFHVSLPLTAGTCLRHPWQLSVL